MHVLICIVFVQSVPAALRLAPSQLAEVLMRVPLVQRLHCCALVCKAFHAASVLATREVVFTGWMSENSLTAGLSWLQAHGQAAGVTRIVFRPNSTIASKSTQQLPFDQLTALQDLELSCSRMPPLPAAVLTSLTYLHCQFSDGCVDELAAFTQLQHLALAGHIFRTGSQLLVFQQALPHLQALTHLSVSKSLAQDAALQGLQELPCLQDLRITSSTCTAALFAALPASLTRLEIECGCTWDSTACGKLELSLSSTTHAQRLTALQHFALSRARAVHPSVLTVLTALTQLDVTFCGLGAGRQEAGWYVLSQLANLQHLDLRDTFTAGIAPRLTAADIAALTAPSQLSYLYVNADVIFQEHYKHLLPADRQLHSLKELYASMDLPADPQVMARLPHCCPNLQVLNLSQPPEGRRRRRAVEFHNNEFAALCRVLGALPELRTLELHMGAVSNTEPVTWQAIGRLDQLHSLGFVCLEFPALHHILELTTCAQLTRLMVHASDPSGFPPEDELEVINEVSQESLAVRLAAAELPCKLYDSLTRECRLNHEAWRQCYVQTAPTVGHA